MQGEIKEYCVKRKMVGGTHEYCGQLILTAEHRLDAMLLALLGRAIFQLGSKPEIKHGRQALAAWLLKRLKIETPEAEELRQHLTNLNNAPDE